MEKEIKMDKPPQQQAVLEKKSIFKNFISNPLGWLSIAIGVVGIILTVYFFNASRENAELCVSISSDKNIIFRKGENSKLKILYEGRKINSDITSTQVFLWNNGKKSIRHSNVLEPIFIVVPNCEILDAILIKESRPIIKTKLNTEYQKKGILPISWDILEKNDGCKIQLIYTGGPDTPIKIVGVIEGQKSINTQKGTFLALSKSVYIWGLFNYLLVAIFTLFLSLWPICCIKEIARSAKLAPKKTQKTIMILVFLLIFLFLILMAIVYLRKCLLLMPPLEWI
jgi:hypothetical protein